MYPQPYLEYLVQFHAERDYFECHEILEEYWKSDPPEVRNPVWVGLIQIAVALYHQRRGNQSGAVKMLDSAIRLLKAHQQKVKELGLDAPALVHLLEGRLEEMRQNVPYRSLNLPIADEALRQAYEQACRERNVPICRDSDMNDSFLLNKHTMRDRSDVLDERKRQLAKKEQQRREQAR